MSSIESWIVPETVQLMVEVAGLCSSAPALEMMRPAGMAPRRSAPNALDALPDGLQGNAGQSARGGAQRAASLTGTCCAEDSQIPEISRRPRDPWSLCREHKILCRGQKPNERPGKRQASQPHI